MLAIALVVITVISTQMGAEAGNDSAYGTIIEMQTDILDREVITRVICHMDDSAYKYFNVDYIEPTMYDEYIGIDIYVEKDNRIFDTTMLDFVKHIYDMQGNELFVTR